MGRLDPKAGKLESYSAVTLKAGQSVAEVDLGVDQAEIDRLSGVTEIRAACEGEASGKKKRQCLERLNARVEQSKGFTANRVLMMLRQNDRNKSLDGFTKSDEYARSWLFGGNQRIPFNQGQDVQVVFGTKYESQKSLSFDRKFGFTFRDSSDLFFSANLNAEGLTQTTLSEYQLTCSRIDGKFEEKSSAATDSVTKKITGSPQSAEALKEVKANSGN